MIVEKSENKDFKKENRMKLFGHEDAGKEKFDRLSAYYFKNPPLQTGPTCGRIVPNSTKEVSVYVERKV